MGHPPSGEPISPDLIAGVAAAISPDGVEVRETHASYVFLSGDRAFKLKKAVVHPFLDYGAPARRHAMCRAEVELNRRLAPDVYLGVRALVPQDDGLRLAPEGSADAVEHLVEMVRFDENATLAAAVVAGRASAEDVAAVGRRLAAFHSDAAVRAGAADQLMEVRRALAETMATLWSHAGDLDRQRLAAAERFGAAFLAARSSDIAARAEAGFVREGHGDLRAEHVLLGPGGIQVVDCVEFDARLRTVDVGADLSFLYMDLVRLGVSGLARSLLRAYREAMGDPGDDALIAFHAAMRAWVRAKVALLSPSDASSGEFMRVGERLAWEARLPVVLAICGMPASGKTTLAKAIGSASGLPVISSDATRKRLAGLSPTERAPDALYSEDASRRTYRELGLAAAEAAASCGGAVVDATLRRRADRAALLRGLARTEAPVVAVECRAPAGIRMTRAGRREAGGGSVSDAGPDVLAKVDRDWEPLDELAPGNHLITRTDRCVEDAMDDLAALLDRRLRPAPSG
jgi:aminoglycoside phosphotransferase family enzyme/predicted kinase